MSRWRAFFLHLLLSVVVIGSIAFGLFSLWYPPELLGFAKGDRLFLIIAVVDIIVGPLLTLIVFKPDKPSLKLDLGVIGLLQVFFLAVGLWTVWASRPVFLVGGQGYFELVFANQLEQKDLAEAAPGFEGMPWFGPRLVGLRDDGSPLSFDQSRATLPRLYQEFEASADYLRGRSRGPGGLTDFVHFLDQGGLEAIQRARAENTEARFLPVASIRGNALFELDPTTMQPLRYVPLPVTATADAPAKAEVFEGAGAPSTPEQAPPEDASRPGATDLEPGQTSGESDAASESSTEGKDAARADAAAGALAR